MGREIKRVALDFDWPLDKVWAGFLLPDSLREITCSPCEGRGYSPEARYLEDRWYGKVPFSPAETGSTPFTPETPEVRAFAERNVSGGEWYYGSGELAIQKEARRLSDLWNGMWMHHLSQDEVDVLIAADRLRDYTHTWSREDGWQKIEPTPKITAEQVNRASVLSWGGSSALGTLMEHNLKLQGKSDRCHLCDGHGSTEAYPGQREDEENWKPTEPPTGEGWQVWETVSEGSPISPVFETRTDLINWLMSSEYTWGASHPLTQEQAENFVNAAWAPSGFVINGEVIPGDQMS